ncbi:MAG TPA: ferrous iron transport protein B [Polyangiaceae bacterium LLY-WYZ-15_(1-7)]|nr:ferrous iron transport protein B [Myxococcales bacterium]MAT25869.1 ferrous iron transport protein B [Sandaracinus sp.]HJL04897.1 ferrous iron transport protein B [Polyangiaceae bacterium LLY-WYZ-15_(1-7)]MBJ74336.1 ferrous iron transport protein B [Sandaracinus sp.]HJL08754.1 ferrous iron transport protein B [Polyangiaceae bacterium LLY-WYZ-15_(1-7)]
MSAEAPPPAPPPAPQEPAAAARNGPMRGAGRPLVLLAGNPNVGKTTVFNRLAGVRARTGNYPGVTVERRTAPIHLGDGRAELVDLPGTYSLSAHSPEEQIAADAILRDRPDAVIVVVDATALARSLYLALQVVETGVPTVVALNMMDEARRAGTGVDRAALEEALGAPVVELVAAHGEGFDALHAALEDVASGRRAPEPPELALDAQTATDVAKVAERAAAELDAEPRLARAWAIWALLSLDEEDELREVPPALRARALQVRAAADEAGRDLDAKLVHARYAFVDALCARALREGEESRSLTERLDAVLVHPVAGLLIFALVMYVIFEALFTWSAPAMEWIEAGVGAVQQGILASMDPGPFRDLLVEGVVAGVGNVLVFVPQIAFLFLLISFLEDSGYLARVAFVIDRVMKGVGLHGKAFVPLLSGFACAVPAVMATRTIADRRDRLVTMLALPLMSCSARLPVYVLITATVFAGAGRVGGVLSAGALALFAMYGLSVLATLGAAAVLRRTALKGPRPTLMLELPPYRMPLARNLLGTTWGRVRTFLVDAGTIILALTIVLWALLAYPRSEAIETRFASLRQEAEATLVGDALEDRMRALDGEEQAAQLEHSAAGRLGKAMEPALEPLGMDWRLGVGVIGAFAAREVFVSTLGMVFGIGGEADEESVGLRRRLQSATWPDGRPLMTPLAGVALMVFFVLACQCMSTVAVVRRESGSWRWPILMVGYMTALAYLAALLVYQVGAALGWGTG